MSFKSSHLVKIQYLAEVPLQTPQQYIAIKVTCNQLQIQSTHQSKYEYILLLILQVFAAENVSVLLFGTFW